MHLEVECFENALTELLSTLSNTKYTKCPQITLLDFSVGIEVGRREI